MLWITHPRGGLPNFRKAVEAGKCSLGVFGGSITDGAAVHNWPHFVSHWLAERTPGLRVTVDNVALGATGSDVGLMRCAREVTPRRCPLVLVEYAVNDSGYSTEYRTRCREGLLRQLLRSGDTDVVVVYTFMREFQPYMTQGEMPPSIAEFETLCEHYNIPSVWMSAHTFEMMQQGLLRYDEWLPDLLHPQFAGSRLYAEPVCKLLEQELTTTNPQRQRSGDRLPQPMNPSQYEGLRVVDWDEVQTEGTFELEYSTRLTASRYMLVSCAPGAKITIPFEGTGLIMAEHFGLESCEFRIRVDDAEPTVTNRERPAWAGANGWLRTQPLCEDLPRGHHTVTLETVFPTAPESTGLLCRIAIFAAV